MINAIKNCSNTKTGAAWLHRSGCLAYSNHRTGVLLSFTSYLHGVFTLLQTMAFQSQIDTDSTNWNNNGIASWFLKIKNQKETNYTMQFICNNRINVASQGKNYEKSLESMAHLHGCQFVWQSNHISACKWPVLSVKISTVCLITRLCSNCCKYNLLSPKWKCFLKLLPQRWDPIEPAMLNITFKIELMPHFYLPND